MKSSPLLRPATRSDLATLLRLVSAFYAHFGYPYSEPQKRRLLATVLDTPTLGRLWLIRDEADDVGYLFLSHYFSLEYGGLTAFIDELFIQPSCRGRGLGSGALLGVIEIAKDLGLTAIHLEAERSNIRAAALYLRLGFVDCERRLLTKVLAASEANLSE